MAKATHSIPAPRVPTPQERADALLQLWRLERAGVPADRIMQQLLASCFARGERS